MTKTIVSDQQLGPSDVQDLADANAVAAFFARLGYETKDRLLQSAAAMGITAEVLERKVRRIERLAIHELGALQVYLVEVDSVTVAAIQALGRVLRDRAGNYLLVLASDYKEIDFVLLERELPREVGDRLTSRRVAIRPRVLTVDRRNPGIVALRVLRRFTYTEVDAYAQYEKLLSAFSVAEWSEPYFNNRALFSDYYLNERLPLMPEWREDPKKPFLRLRQLYVGARERLAGADEAKLWIQLVGPILAELGFNAQSGEAASEKRGPEDYLLSNSSGEAAAGVACLAYPWDRYLDGKDEARDASRSEDNPGSRIVSVLERVGVSWAILTNGKLWRLYAAAAHSRSTNYYEIDLEETLALPDPNEAFRYFWLIFRSASFAARQTFLEGQSRTMPFVEELLEGSVEYAKRLGARLKDRVFEEVFPELAKGFVAYLRHLDPTRQITESDLETIFAATLVFLYRLLFLLYAESRDLLPAREIRGYWEKSLSKLKQEVANAGAAIKDDVTDRLAKKYSGGPSETTLYDRLALLARVVDSGDPALNTPVYNGGLFMSSPNPSDRSPEAKAAQFMAGAKIPDRNLALALDRLARDVDEKRGDLVPIDYKSLGVRQLGSIYEGLLEFRLQIAPERMAVVAGKTTEETVPYQQARREGRKILTEGRGKNGRERTLAEGEVYLENSRRERKATGSYYTPDHIVKYIVERAVGPNLEQHLERLRTPLRAAQRSRREANERAIVLGGPSNLDLQAERQIVDELFNFRVLDPAMGSGHFLVEAVDFITDKILDFLNAFPWNPIQARLRLIRETILAEMDRHGVSIDPAKLNDVNLLKRQVLKRCIYGVDLNPLAVELAKVSLWLDCFTLGAPLSFIDHHLKTGNSLIGSSIAQVQSSLDRPRQLSLFGSSEFSRLLLAVDLMRRIGELSDITANQVEESRMEFQQANEALAPARSVLDVFTSGWFQSRPSRVRRPHRTNNAVDFLATSQAEIWLRSDCQVSRLEPEARQFVENSLDMARRRKFFHWEIEFPEVFFQPDGTSPDVVRVADSPGFDAVVGNPPYGVDIDQVERDYFGSQLVNGSVENIAGVFVAKSQFLSRSALGMIIPKSFTYSAGWRPVVEAVLPTLSSLLDVSRAFAEVRLEQVVFVCTSKRETPSYMGARFGSQEADDPVVPKSVYRDLEVLVTGLTDSEFSLGMKMTASGVRMGQVSDTFRGLPWQRHVSSSGSQPILGGRHVVRYGLRSKPWRIGLRGTDRDKVARLLKQKIVSQNLVAHVQNPVPHIRIIATLDQVGVLDLDTVNNTISVDANWSPLLLLAFMNSKALSWYMYRFIYNQAIRTMHFDKEYVDKLPLPKHNGHLFGECEQLVQQALNARSRDAIDEFQGLDHAIDNCVYKAFELTDAEIGLIDRSTHHGQG